VLPAPRCDGAARPWHRLTSRTRGRFGSGCHRGERRRLTQRGPSSPGCQHQPWAEAVCLPGAEQPLVSGGNCFSCPQEPLCGLWREISNGLWCIMKSLPC